MNIRTILLLVAAAVSINSFLPCAAVWAQETRGPVAQTRTFDVVIVGGTPGGIMAAIAAARGTHGSDS